MCNVRHVSLRTLELVVYHWHVVVLYSTGSTTVAHSPSVALTGLVSFSNCMGRFPMDSSTSLTAPALAGFVPQLRSTPLGCLYPEGVFEASSEHVAS